MVLSRSRMLYIAGVLAAGVATGLFLLRNPSWQQADFPPVIWPVVVSLAIDIVIGQMAAQGRAEPLTMGDRLAAVIGAGLIITIMQALGT